MNSGTEARDLTETKILFIKERPQVKGDEFRALGWVISSSPTIENVRQIHEKHTGCKETFIIVFEQRVNIIMLEIGCAVLMASEECTRWSSSGQNI